jgi:hypothetical protein
VLLAHKWHKIKVGFLPVTTFASLLGIATILHWDRFNHGHISFFAWAGLYFSAPFLVFGVWLRNRTQDPGRAYADDVIVPRLVRLVIGGIGAITLAISILLFVQPALMTGLWPWSLTPLTARVVGVMFALPGVVGLGIALDARWSAAQIILQSQSFSILLILIAAVRAWSDFDTLNPATWLFVGGLAGMLAGIILLYLGMEARRGRRGKTPQQIADHTEGLPEFGSGATRSGRESA